jgi:tetratricopeptide (TPR) repeat protein
VEDKNKTGTFVDLGEDLLGNSAVTKHGELPHKEPEPDPEPESEPEQSESLVLIQPPSPVEEISIQTAVHSADRIVEDARILMDESLVDEAKKKLFSVLRVDPTHLAAVALLKEIRDRELSDLRHEGGGQKRKNDSGLRESREMLIQKLEKDFGLESEGRLRTTEIFRVQSSEGLNGLDRFELMIAFSEMGCPADALREARRIERDLLMESSTLGAYGLVIKEVEGRSLLAMDQAFEAQLVVLESLQSLEYNLEQKLGLMVLAGEIEEALGNASGALGWYSRVLETDAEYRDIANRFRSLRKNNATKKN